MPIYFLWSNEAYEITSFCAPKRVHLINSTITAKLYKRITHVKILAT